MIHSPSRSSHKTTCKTTKNVPLRKTQTVFMAGLLRSKKKSFSKERVRDNCATTSFLQDIRSKLTKFQFGNDFATSLFLSLHNYTNNGEQLTGLMKLQNARIAIEFLSKKNYRCLLPFCFSENVPESRGDPLQQYQLLLLGREQRDQRLHG
jgi:hypothetical protein